MITGNIGTFKGKKRVGVNFDNRVSGGRKGLAMWAESFSGLENPE